MNILLTGAGRRNFLVHYFRQALGPSGKVIACDASPDAPAMTEADESIVVPSMDHPSYFNALESICREKRVRLIVPVNDLEIAGMARHAPQFHAVGAIPLVPSPAMVTMCQDKWAAFQWLRARGISVPETFETLASARAAIASGALRFPFLMKPRWGTSSIGIETVENARELELAHEWGLIQLHRTLLAKLSKPDCGEVFLYQERLVGQEYGMDVVNDLNGNYAATLARRKLVMRAGNTDRAISVVDPGIERLGQLIGRGMAQPGSVDCDVMAVGDSHFVLDINPRLGGGYPFSHLAGANLPAALVAWAEGTLPDPAWLSYRPGVFSAKFEGVMIVERPRSTSTVE